MKCVNATKHPHREKDGDSLFGATFWSLVSKDIPKSRWQQIPDAIKAVEKEWEKLRKINTWDESRVEAKRSVKKRYERMGKPVNFGRLHDICVEKFSELPEKDRVYKGRVVFGGHDIRQAEGLQVLFNDGGSGASFISASKVVDAVSMLPGCNGEQADAPMAYTQALIEGTDTYVTLPQHAWPKGCKERFPHDEPVCPLRLSLYGHPMTGVHWERHCHKKLREAGFENIPGWECVFIRWQLQCILSVYVDDFKLAGPKENIDKAWALIQKGVKLDKIAPFDHYLRCGQHPTTVSEKDVAKRLENISNHLVDAKADVGSPTGTGEKLEPTTKSKVGIRGCRYDMSGFVQQTVEKYLELSGKDESSLKKVTTPSIDDHTIDPKEFEEKGELASDGPGGWHPAKVLMKMLYCARIVRLDLLWTICSLARQVTKWTRASDRKLHRLVSYLHHSQDISLEAFVGNTAAELAILWFSDADFAGDIKDSKSTSGCYLALCGPHTFVPIAAMSKKQSVVSHSSTESEIVSLEQGMRSEALPLLTLWEYVVAMFKGDKRMKGKYEKEWQNPLAAVPATGGNVIIQTLETMKACSEDIDQMKSEIVAIKDDVSKLGDKRVHAFQFGDHPGKHPSKPLFS